MRSLKESLLNVEIEVNSRCNRSCSYCPVSLKVNNKIKPFMDREVFERVISQLQALDYDGRVSYHFYGEPLLRKDLEELISYTHLALPKAHLVLFSNGDFLTDARYESLIRSG